jgi:O-antigen/teichoic acid export membrane protein
VTDLEGEVRKAGGTMDEPTRRPRRARGTPSWGGEPGPRPAQAHRRHDADPFDRPFVNPLTATIDLSSLRQHLAFEEFDELGRVEFGPRLFGHRRPATADPDSTQILPRSARTGTPPRSPGVYRPHDAGWYRPSDDLDDPDRTAYLRLGGPSPADLDAGHDTPPDPSPQTSDTQPDTRPGIQADTGARDGGEDDYGLSNLAVDEQAGRHRGRPPAASGRSKVVWTLVDQVISSGTNTLIGVIVARSVSRTEFGAFSIAFTLFALFIGLSRAGATSVLGIRYSAAAPRLFRSAAAAATGTGLVVGISTGFCVVMAGAAIGGVVGESLVAIGILFPGLLLQDAWRYVFFAEGRPSTAAANDMLWAFVQLGAVLLLVTRNVSSASAMLLAWGGAAAVAAFVGVAQAGFWPAPERCSEWLWDHREICGYVSLEYITVQGAQQASTLLIGVLAAVEVVGALRGVQILLGPTTVLAVGIVSFAIPEFSRRKDMSSATRLRAAYLLSGAVVGAGLLWGLVFFLLPDSVGAALLGETWHGARDILILTIIQQAGAAATVGPSCMLYALGRAKITFRVNLLLAPQLVIWPIVGLQLWGVRGAVVGYIITFWVTVPVWFRMLRRAVHEHAGADERDYAEDAEEGDYDDYDYDINEGVDIGYPNRDTAGPGRVSGG